MHSVVFLVVVLVIVVSANAVSVKKPGILIGQLRQNIERVEEAEAGIQPIEKPNVIHRFRRGSKATLQTTIKKLARSGHESQFEWIQGSRMGSDTFRIYNQLKARKASPSQEDVSVAVQNPQTSLRK